MKNQESKIRTNNLVIQSQEDKKQKISRSNPGWLDGERSAGERLRETNITNSKRAGSGVGRGELVYFKKWISIFQLQKINKRGDVPTAILVLGVFVLCALALISFYASGIFVKNTFFGPDLVEQMNSKINDYNFYSAKNLNVQEIQEILLLEEDFYINENPESVKYFEINKTAENFKFGGLSFNKEDWSEEKLLISVKYFLG